MQVVKTRSGSKTSFVSEIDNLVNEKMMTEKHTTEKQTTEQYGTSKPTSIAEEVQDKESQLIPVKELSDTPKDNQDAVTAPIGSYLNTLASKEETNKSAPTIKPVNLTIKHKQAPALQDFTQLLNRRK